MPPLAPTPFALEQIGLAMLDGPARPLSAAETEGLWSIFSAINRTWALFHTRDAAHPVADASNLRSTWLECVRLRAEPPAYDAFLAFPEPPPSYAADYENAVAVLASLTEAGGADAAFAALLLANCADPTRRTDRWVDPATRLGHAKRFVVDEFMTVMIVASGFKEFGGRNYNGFVGGSRFDRATAIRKPVAFPERRPER